MKHGMLANRFWWLTILCIVAVGPSVFAQQPPMGPPADRTNPDRARQQDMSRREWKLRNMGVEPKAETDQRRLQILAEQIEEDFNKILTLHNKIVRAISTEQPLDYHFVAAATEEIRKRSSHLQSTLALQELEPRPRSDEKPVVPDQAQIKSALITLCKQIKSFVTNPVIETPGTINAEQLGKARQDLEDIVRLSERIKKDAAKLEKARN